MSLFHVYALSDPRDGILRYVGVTSRPGRRAAAHRRGEGAPSKRAWTRELHAAGEAPRFSVLSKHDDHREALRAEARAIREALRAGCHVFNVAGMGLT